MKAPEQKSLIEAAGQYGCAGVKLRQQVALWRNCRGRGMKVVELYGRVRYAVQIEGLSRREAARQFGQLGTNHPSDVLCPPPRRIERVRVSITSPLVQPSPNGRRVGIRIVTFEACSGFTCVTARRIAQPPKVTFVTRLRSRQLPSETARQPSGPIDNYPGG